MRAEVCDPYKLELVCRYMHEKTDVVFQASQVQGFAILSDDNTFVAGVIVSNVRMHNDKAIDCEISCASESSIAWRPEVCRAVFGYVFNQLGCVRCTSITKKNNNKSRAFLEALNFKLEGNVRLGYDGEKDALIYGLLAGDCEFLGDLNG
jgi:hypothetical protein